MTALKRSRTSGLSRREAIAGYAFISPWVIGFLAFLVVPIGMSLYAAFTRWTIIDPPPRWLGVGNFVQMVTKDRYFFWSLGITLKYTLMVVPLQLALGLGLALLLNQKLRGMNIFRTIFYVPSIVAGVAVAILWLNLLGPATLDRNTVLRALGVQQPPNWLNSATWSLPAIALMSLWGVGGGAILYLAGLQNIPVQMYEAAEIDGANSWQAFWKITLPLLSPTMFFMLITLFIAGFQVFTPALILGGTGTLNSSIHVRFYVLHMYLRSFREGQLGYGAALAWVLILLSAIAVLLLFRNFERFVHYEEVGADQERDNG